MSHLMYKSSNFSVSTGDMRTFVLRLRICNICQIKPVVLDTLLLEIRVFTSEIFIWKMFFVSRWVGKYIGVIGFNQKIATWNSFRNGSFQNWLDFGSLLKWRLYDKAMLIYRQFRTIYRQFFVPQHGFVRVCSRTRVQNLATICLALC